MDQLSLAPPAADAPKSTVDLAEPPVATVLLVDDDPASLGALAAILGPLGLRVVTVASSAAAFAASARRDVALVLMAAETPTLDGPQTARRIKHRRRSRDLPIILVGDAAPDSARAAEGYACGAVDYLRRPLVPATVRAKVSAFVALHVAAERRAAALRRRARELKTEHALALAALLAQETALRADALRANRLKDDLLSTVSHELRTPLSSMLGWTQILRRGKLAPEAIAKALEIIERNGKTQDRVIEDILDVSRILRGGLQLTCRVLDLDALVGLAVDAIRPAADTKRIALEVALDTAAPPLWGDGDRLQQVLVNLLSNAVKYTPEDGRVAVAVTHAGSRLQVTICDTGAGIPADQLPEVFDRLQWADRARGASHSGLGFGLAIAQHIVHLHGGTVAAQSPGRGLGATFTVTLPGQVVEAAASPGAIPRVATLRPVTRQPTASSQTRQRRLASAEQATDPLPRN